MKHFDLAKRILAGLLSFALLAGPALAWPQQQSTSSSTQNQQKKNKSDKEDVDKIGNRDVDGKLNFHSLEWDIQVGKYYSQEIERSAKLIDDPIVNEYVNRVGQNLVRNSDAKVPFTIKVVDDDSLNAFALPGGFFYVNSGLILAATEEAELAGVMAHEIAHVTARHGARGDTRGQLAQYAMLPLLIFGPGGWAGYGIYQGLNFFVPLTFLQFSRGFEREADYLGLQYLYKTGYDPNAYISFFEKVQAQEKKRPGSIPKIFSSHPPSAERIRNTQNEIATILPTRGEYIVSTSEFDFVKERLRQIQSATKAQEDSSDKPTLRKRTEKEAEKKGKDKQTKTEDDEDRPTLKRRP
jgi:predicted Zn-dependent protease